MKTFTAIEKTDKGYRIIDSNGGVLKAQRGHERIFKTIDAAARLIYDSGCREIQLLFGQSIPVTIHMDGRP